MVLDVAYVLVSSAIPSGYYIPVAAAVVALVIVYAFAQGRTTTRERDLHARHILITVAYRYSYTFRLYTKRSGRNRVHSPHWV